MLNRITENWRSLTLAVVILGLAAGLSFSGKVEWGTTSGWATAMLTMIYNGNEKVNGVLKKIV